MSWIVLKSVPAPNRCVAKESRNVSVVTRLDSPAFFRASVQTLVGAPWVRPAPPRCGGNSTPLRRYVSCRRSSEKRWSVRLRSRGATVPPVEDRGQDVHAASSVQKHTGGHGAFVPSWLQSPATAPLNHRDTKTPRRPAFTARNWGNARQRKPPMANPQTEPLHSARLLPMFSAPFCFSGVG